MNTAEINRILEFMLGYKAEISDLNFSVGRPPQVESDGVLIPVPVRGMEKLNPFQTEMIALSIMGQDREVIRKLVHTGSTDLSYAIPGLTRFRVNIFSQRGTFAIAMRVIPQGVPSIAKLGLPEVLYQVAKEKNGIVLVTGPTGCGKSTTLAAILDEINETQAYHIVTIEDPIEYLHTNRVSTINQREIGSDTTTFAFALRAALRQAPKVILVGEMRDLETAEIALEAAETGHLVFSTLHTIDASKTIDRIIGIFPKEEEQQIRIRFAQCFKYIISQRLVPKMNAGRIAAIEILKSTMRTREYIVKGEGEHRSLLDAMNDGYLEGMQTFDKELATMFQNGIIEEETALTYATTPNNLALILKGFSAGQSQSFLDDEDKQEDLEEPSTSDANKGTAGKSKPKTFPAQQKPEWME